jgi:thiamine biosynthesis lipoprotein
MKLPRIFAIFFFLLLGSCRDHHDPLQHFRGIAMTIPYHIAVDNPCPKEVIQTIEATFAQVHDTFDKWNPTSEVSRFNNWKSTEPFECSDMLWHLLQWCDLFYTISCGAFDPTVEPLETLWIEKLEQGTTPSTDDLSHLPPVGWHQVQLQEKNVVRKSHPDLQLDLGGIAKGYAVDLLVERLSSFNLHSIYVEWGGEIRVQGPHPEGRPWKIGISSPVAPSRPLRVVELQDASLATSGDYYQYWDVLHSAEKKRFFHVFDVKALKPMEVTEKSIISATVQHETCLVADAIATILLMAKDKEQVDTIATEKILPSFPSARWYVYTGSS